MIAVDSIVEGATVLTLDDGVAGPVAGPRQSFVGEIADGALAIRGGRIVAVGPRHRVDAAFAARERTDLGGRVVLPGLVDAHTHPLWSGSRASEFEQRVAGATYLDIMAAGGGIARTVRETRAASDQELLSLLGRRLDRFMAHGTTTVEAKTGYGLSVSEELRHLDLLARADDRHPVHVVPTFLGAHAVPDEYRDDQAAYVDLVVEEMLPAAAERNPTAFCDVFCDVGAFTLQEAERVLEKAAQLGMPLKVHADEFASLGATSLAVRLGAASADHLATTTTEERLRMAGSDTVAVLLPGTTFGLGSSHYADARAFVESGVPIALGTDFNPGTCPCESLPFMVALAARYMAMTPAEGLVAVTRNAACAVGRDERAGRLAAGRSADLVVIDSDDYRDLAYRFGTNPVAGVMIGGTWTIRPDPRGT
jgi:imidazolonepropionase